MTNNSGITLVHDVGGDWIGVYKDGELVDEGHSLSPEMLLDACGIPYCSRDDWDGEIHGRLNEKLEDVVFGLEEV